MMARTLVFEVLAIVFACQLSLALSVSSYTNCSGILTSASQSYSYDISALIGIQVNTSRAETLYNISICESGIPKCGLCDTAGFCEIEQWYSNCVGQFGSLVALDNGTGVTLYYPNGEFGRSGTVELICDPNSPPIGRVEIDYYGNEAKIYSSLACPIDVPPPPSGNCSNAGSNCQDCLSIPDCAYCLDTMSCIDSTQNCGDYWKLPALCSKLDVCQFQSTCSNCTALTPSNGCFWCPTVAGGSCMRSLGQCSSGKITKPQFCL